MIGLIIQTLKTVDYEEGGELIKIAKGKHEVPSSWKEIMRMVKDRIDG